MKNWKMNLAFLMMFFIMSSTIILAPKTTYKKVISESEKVLIASIFEEISITDQLYREKLSKETLDEKIIAQIDSVFENEGVQAGFVYEKSLNLSLPQAVKDSLWELQAALDLQNHLTLKGLWDVYGFIPKDIIKEKNYVQTLLLLHPPRDWNVPTYLKEYSEMLIVEVRAGRMPAFAYASFYDNMKAKILREPQLYGTNQQFSPKKNIILPPIIEDLEKTNLAREDIGLPALKEGEYRIETE